MEGVFIPKNNWEDSKEEGCESLCVCVCVWGCDLYKLLCVLMELFQYWQRLFRKAVLEDALDDSAAVGVSGEGKDLRCTDVTPYKRWPGGKMTGICSDI